MTNAKSTKRALVASVLVLALCFSMLVGTTFAWFTDSVTSANNVITSGNLDITLEYYDGTKWKDVAGQSDILDGSLWEPGYVDVAYLRIKNAGSLALKYQFGVNIVSETKGKTKDGVEFKLSDYIYYDVNETTAYTPFANRDAAMAIATETTKISAGYNKAGTLAANSDYVYIAMVVYMPETVGNEACHDGTNVPKIDLGINVVATQLNSENDSFGNDFDEDAIVDGWQVYNAQDLQAAIANGETEIVLMDDMEITESIVIPAPAATTYSRNAGVVINLNGKTISGTVGRDADNNRIHTIINYGNVTITNGTVASQGDNGGSAIYNADGATLVLENDVTILGAPFADNAWPSYGINNYGNLTVNGATIKTYHGGIATGGNGVTVVNDAQIDVGQNTTTKQTSWALYNFENGTLTVNGGVFENTKNENNKVYGGGYICASSTNPTTINGGTFNKTEGDNNGTGFYYKPTNLVINGGIFDTDPSKYLTDDFKAVAFEGDYIVVGNDVTVVYNEDTLKAALANGEKNVYVLNDIKLTKNATVTIANGADSTIDLNGFKISAEADNSGNQSLFTVNGTLTVKNGSMEYVALNNQGWNAMATIFNVTAGGILNMDGVTANVGGTDMNFIVHLNNWGEVTLNVDNCDFTATYVAVRAFNSGPDMNNITITNTDFHNGRVFWVHNYTSADMGGKVYAGASANYDKSAVDARLNIKMENNTSDNAKPIRIGMTGATYYNLDGIQLVDGIITVDPAPIAEDFLFPAGTKVVMYKDMIMSGDAQIIHTENVGLGLHNVTAEVNHDLIIRQSGGAICISDCEFTLTDGAKLIVVGEGGDAYQVFLINVKVNGVLLTQENAGQYLEGISWFGAYAEWPNT